MGIIDIITIGEKLENFAAECLEGSTKKWEGGSLYGALLWNANLLYANLQDVCLQDANLRGADLTGANLRGADLRGANLYDADLRFAHLEGADLRGAKLNKTDLGGAWLENVNLRDTWLQSSNLRGAKLRGADLTDSQIWRSDLTGVNLEGAKGFRFEDTPDPQTLRYKVADQIENNPELLDQNEWGDGAPDECGTPCCVAGWACRLGGGTRGEGVMVAALRLLHIDGKEMPSFHHDTNRTKILEALRA